MKLGTFTRGTEKDASHCYLFEPKSTLIRAIAMASFFFTCSLLKMKKQKMQPRGWEKSIHSELFWILKITFECALSKYVKNDF